MTALSHSRIAPHSGYLLHLRRKADGATRAWLFLLTADFEPLAELGRVLARLAQAAQELAARESCALEERSVSRIEEVFADDNPAWPLGRVADLREYTYADGTPDADRFEWHLEQLLSGRGVARMVPVTGAVARAGESLFGREQAAHRLAADRSRRSRHAVGAAAKRQDQSAAVAGRRSAAGPSCHLLGPGTDGRSALAGGRTVLSALPGPCLSPAAETEGVERSCPAKRAGRVRSRVGLANRVV